MKSFLFTLVIFLTITAEKCKKEKHENVPACILEKIEQIKKEPKWNPAAEVYEYTYGGKRVFYFSSNCCDQYNVVCDENCNTICAPSGGFSGKGDGKCADFNDKATEVRLVWKDER